MMMVSGLPINCGCCPVDTLTTLVIAPFPGKPLSLGIETSGFVEINFAPLRTAKVAIASFSYVTASSKPITT